LPDSIIEKNIQEMSAAEKERYYKHTVLGSDLIKDVKGLENIALIIRNHHESFSGKGFPDGLEGENIHKGARIIAVADLYDRYRYPPGKSVIGSKKIAENMLQMASGSRLDEHLVEVFLNMGIPNYTEEGEHEIEISFKELKPGMVLARDIVNFSGRPILKKFVVFNDELIEELLNSSSFDSVVSRIFILKDSLKGDVEEDASAADEGGQESKEEPVVAQAIEVNKPLVIVVDDERHVVNALRRELRSGGYEVEAFTEPIEALQQLRYEKHTHAFITDYNMPGVRGDRLLAQVQKEYPDLPCIVITGKATKDTVAQLVSRAKLTRILPKPWDKKILLNTLDGLKK
jgi:response regulator RpfG family c-di-GMP phosphodiesterase